MKYFANVYRLWGSKRCWIVLWASYRRLRKLLFHPKYCLCVSLVKGLYPGNKSTKVALKSSGLILLRVIEASWIDPKESSTFFIQKVLLDFLTVPGSDKPTQVFTATHHCCHAPLGARDSVQDHNARKWLNRDLLESTVLPSWPTNSTVTKRALSSARLQRLSKNRFDCTLQEEWDSVWARVVCAGMSGSGIRKISC